MTLLLLNEDELRQVVTIPEAIDVAKNALIAAAQGKMRAPGCFSLNLPDVNGDVDVKGTYIQDSPYFAVKIGSNFQDNSLINLPAQSGLIVVLDAVTGFPAALMFDNGYLANIRAGVSGALAAQYLANEQINTVAVIGAGSQAFIQLKALMAVRHIELAYVWSVSPLDADNYARRMVEDHDLNIDIAFSVEAAVKQADLVIVTTSHETTRIQANWLKPGTHITTVGQIYPSPAKLVPDTLHRADIIVVDNLEQCSQSGEIRFGPSKKLHIHGELDALVHGKIPGRTSPSQITLADLTGLDSLDAAIATLAMEKALFLGLGQRITVGLGQEQIGPRIDTLL